MEVTPVNHSNSHLHLIPELSVNPIEDGFTQYRRDVSVEHLPNDFATTTHLPDAIETLRLPDATETFHRNVSTRYCNDLRCSWDLFFSWLPCDFVERSRRLVLGLTPCHSCQRLLQIV